VPPQQDLLLRPATGSGNVARQRVLPGSEIARAASTGPLPPPCHGAQQRYRERRLNLDRIFLPAPSPHAPPTGSASGGPTAWSSASTRSETSPMVRPSFSAPSSTMANGDSIHLTRGFHFSDRKVCSRFWKVKIVYWSRSNRRSAPVGRRRRGMNRISPFFLLLLSFVVNRIGLLDRSRKQ
jgi:hypothetical protein